MGLGSMLYNWTVDPLLSGLRSQIIAKVAVGSSLIDIACGTGELLRSFNGNCSFLMGIDSSSEMIALGKKKMMGIPEDQMLFLEMDVMDVDKLEESQFDYSVLSMALHQFPSEERMKIIKKSLYVSKTLIIADYNEDIRGFFRRFFVFLIERFAGREHYRHFKSYNRQGGISGILEKHGFQILETSRSKSGFFNLILLSKNKK